MARAKNTTRAEARRRYRLSQASDTSASGQVGASDDGTAVAETAGTPERGRLFRLPDVRGDIRALPGMLLSRKALWIPFILVIAAFLVGMAGNRQLLPTAISDFGAILVQLVLPPQALLAYFIAGFLAPRGSYLIGLLLGLLAGPLYGIWYWDAFQAQLLQEGVATSLEQILILSTFQGILFGTLAAAFASWYRRFLRTSQERARANRVAREQQARIRQREAERTARRSASGRTTTP